MLQLHPVGKTAFSGIGHCRLGARHLDEEIAKLPAYRPAQIHQHVVVGHDSIPPIRRRRWLVEGDLRFCFCSCSCSSSSGRASASGILICLVSSVPLHVLRVIQPWVILVLNISKQYRSWSMATSCKNGIRKVVLPHGKYNIPMPLPVALRCTAGCSWRGTSPPPPGPSCEHQVPCAASRSRSLSSCCRSRAGPESFVRMIRQTAEVAIRPEGKDFESDPLPSTPTKQNSANMGLDRPWLSHRSSCSDEASKRTPAT